MSSKESKLKKSGDLIKKDSYKPEFCVDAIEFLAKKKTLTELAAHCGITTQGMDKWRTKYPEFDDAIERGKKLSTISTRSLSTLKYNDGIPAKVVELLSQGLSRKAAAAKLGITSRTFMAWRHKHPEFNEAVEHGDALSQLYWEEAGMDGMKGKIDKFNSQVWTTSMKARFGYTEKQEITTQQEINSKLQVEFVNTVDTAKDVTLDVINDDEDLIIK